MKLVIEYYVSQRRGGVSATAPQLRLAGHGLDRDSALASLRRAAAAWVMGLTAADRLPEALARCGIRCEDGGSEGYVIDLRMA